jgi:chain length determinant protein tyrosine kinase EpsG
MRLGELTAAPAKNSPVLSAGRSIGAILVDAGKLKPEDAERVLRVAQEMGIRFGDAAKELGLITQQDIDLALSRQFDYPYLMPGESSVSEEVVAAFEPFSRRVEALRVLRSQLLLRWFDSNPARKALAVVSASRGEGRSFIAANLAVVFSQLGRQRTLLIDADLRNPRQHQLFGLDNRSGLSSVLSERAGGEVVRRIPGLLDLSGLPAGILPPNPQELLTRPQFAKMLHQLAAYFDVIVLDTPAASDSADAQTITVRAGAALIVVKKNASRTWRVRGIAGSMDQAKATIVGAVLNDF